MDEVRLLGASPAQTALQVYGPAQAPQKCAKKLLARSGVGATAAPVVAEFEISTPSAKVLTMVKVFVRVPPGSTRDPFASGYSSEYNAQATLWLVDKHTPADGSKPVPVAGYGTTPTFGIPVSDELWGWTTEVQTAGTTELRGLLTVPAGVNPANGMDWHVEVTYQAIEPCSAAEWGRLLGKAGIRVVTGEGKQF